MKIVFNADELLPKLSQVVGVVNSKNSLPILGDVVFKTTNFGVGRFQLVLYFLSNLLKTL